MRGTIDRYYGINDPFVTHWHPSAASHVLGDWRMEFELDPKEALSRTASARSMLRRACETGVGPSLNCSAGLLWRAWGIWVGAPYVLSWSSSKKVLWLQQDGAYTPMCRSFHQALYSLSCLSSLAYQRRYASSQAVERYEAMNLGEEWVVQTAAMTKAGVQNALEANMAWPENYGLQIERLMKEEQPIKLKYWKEPVVETRKAAMSVTIGGIERC